jgi:hypothetical protein
MHIWRGGWKAPVRGKDCAATCDIAERIFAVWNRSTLYQRAR